MMDKNFKHNLDKELKDIYVTEELKRKTLEKCKCRGNRYNKIWMWNKWTKGAALACSFILVFSCSYFLANKSMVKRGENYTMNDESKGEVNQKGIEEKLKKDTAVNNYSIFREDIPVTKEEKHENDNKNSKPVEERIKVHDKKSEVKESEIKKAEANMTKQKDIQDDKKDLYNKKQEEKIAASRSLEKNNIELKIQEAEKFWKGKIVFPSYIPKEFKLDDICIHEKNSNICVNIIYRNEDNYFQIEQVKGEEIKTTLDNVQNISKFRGLLQEIEINKDGVCYRVKGNVPKDVLEEIIESIK